MNEVMEVTAPVCADTDDVVWTVEQATTWLNARGYNYSPRTVQRAARSGALPFHRGITDTDNWYIWRSRLLKAVLPGGA